MKKSIFKKKGEGKDQGTGAASYFFHDSWSLREHTATLPLLCNSWRFLFLFFSLPEVNPAGLYMYEFSLHLCLSN